MPRTAYLDNRQGCRWLRQQAAGSTQSWQCRTRCERSRSHMWRGLQQTQPALNTPLLLLITVQSLATFKLLPFHHHKQIQYTPTLSFYNTTQNFFLPTTNHLLNEVHTIVYFQNPSLSRKFKKNTVQLFVIYDRLV